MTRQRYIPLLSLLWLLLACGGEPEQKNYEVAEVPPPPQALDLYSSEVDSLISLMSPEEKVRELVWIDLQTDVKLKKPFLIPRFGKLNHSVLSVKNLQIDTSFYNSFYTQDAFLPFRDYEDVGGFEPGDLNTVSDTAFWRKMELTRIAFFQREKIDAVLLDSINGFLSLTDSVAFKESKGLFLNHILTGGAMDSSRMELGEFLDGMPIALIQDPDSIPDYGDTICHFHLKTESWTDSIKEVFKEQILLGKFDGIKLKVETIEQLENVSLFLSSDEVLDLISEELLDYKVRKSLALKLWSQELTATLKPHLIPVNSKSVVYESKYKSITLLKNSKSLLPITDFPEKKWKFVYIGEDNRKSFDAGVSNYGSIDGLGQKLSSFSPEGTGENPLVVLLDNQLLDSISAKTFVDKIKKTSMKCIVVNVGNPENLKWLNEIPTLVQVWNTGGDYGSHIAQLVMGGNPFCGGVPQGISLKPLKTPKIRLAYSIPEEVGISEDSLKKVDKIAAEAIWGGATPGCQVFIAKEGKVICNKGFGYHTYANKIKVDTETTYDIASVTKVAATTICGMHMYDRGLYKMNDSLKLHLPDSLTKCLGHFSRLYNLTFQRLFTHTSGLPAGLPIYKYMMYTDSIVGRWDKYYCDEQNKWFKVEVAKDFYMDSAYLDTLWLETNNIWTGEKKYKYSDANLNVLYQIFRSKLSKNQRYEKYLDSVFYNPLGMDGTAFLPRVNLDTLKHPITPTENEKYWRHQLIKGFVHDPNAAMYGGVAGNAGLFSNAHDLGILMQMLMNGGSYGGKQFIQPTTVKKFRIHQEGSHRGLGFDKPTASSGNVVAPDCPYTAYGHTGFTGICVWNDPENDLVFVFTSNRVHPNANNKKIITFGVRKRLHQVVYDQLYYNGVYKNEATGNQPVTRSNEEKAV